MYDERIKSVEVTCYGQTKVNEAKVGEVVLFTFDAIYEQPNTMEATAYDANGNIIYRLDLQDNRWTWVPVTE